MQFDQSTTTVALGKITMAKAAGETIPEGWAVDRGGRPTTDPGAALEGSLMSAGGYKGWGLGLMVEVMAAAMTGSVNSLDVVGLKAAFAERIERVTEAVASQPGARLPGQGRRSIDPVAVDDALWAKLEALAAAG